MISRFRGGKHKSEKTHYEMKSKTDRSGGFTVLELLLTIVAALVVAAVALPFFAGPRHSCRLNCTNNLKQIGLAFKTWAIDNADRYPMQVSTNLGGAMEWSNGPVAFVHFQVMSNELSTPRVLLCPLEKKKTYATNFSSGFSNPNLSYFVALDTDATNAFGFLCGDRTLTNGVGAVANVLTIATNQMLSWTPELHRTENWPRKPTGNIGIGDGSVQQMDATTLNAALRRTGARNRLLMP